MVASVTNENPFRVVASLDATTSNSVTKVVLKNPSAVSVNLTNTDGNFDFEQGFTNKTLLDKNYAAGKYAFTIVTLNDGTNLPTLTLAADNYPAVPKILNWTDLQTVEPEQPLAIYWGSFTNGTTNDFIIVDISQTNGDVVASTPALLEVNALTGTNFAAAISANLLDYNQTYEGRLLFVKRTALSSTNYPGVPGFTGYYRQTKFPLLTLPTPPNHGRIQFSAQNYSVGEAADTANLTVTRSGTEGDASVDIFYFQRHGDGWF